MHSHGMCGGMGAQEHRAAGCRPRPMGSGHGRRHEYRMPGLGGPPFGRGPMARRGDVRSAILTLLAERPMHGYQIIGELESRSGGAWRPSAGSVYPTLQQLEDEGLVHADERDGRRVFELTDAGREHVSQRPEGREAPWKGMAGPAGDADDLRELLFQVGAATMQVARVGTSEVVAQVREILADTRRRLYRMLAEDEPASAKGPADE